MGLNLVGGILMPKFHIEWKMNTAVMSDDPTKLGEQYFALLEMVKAEVKANKITDWGVYCNGFSGYTIREGSHDEIAIGLLKYMPFVIFDVKPVINEDQAIDAVKAVSQMMEK
jgi:hypothetical protein